MSERTRKEDEEVSGRDGGRRNDATREVEEREKRTGGRELVDLSGTRVLLEKRLLGEMELGDEGRERGEREFEKRSKAIRTYLKRIVGRERDVHTDSEVVLDPVEEWQSKNEGCQKSSSTVTMEEVKDERISIVGQEKSVVTERTHIETDLLEVVAGERAKSSQLQFSSAEGGREKRRRTNRYCMTGTFLRRIPCEIE